MGRGKTVDTFNFDINGIKIAIGVKLLKDDKTGESSFKVQDSDYDLSFENTDIEALRLAVKAKLEHSLSIKWERFLYIKFESSNYIARENAKDKVTLAIADDPPFVDRCNRCNSVIKPGARCTHSLCKDSTPPKTSKYLKEERVLPNSRVRLEFEFKLIEIGTTNGGDKCHREIEDGHTDRTHQGMPELGISTPKWESEGPEIKVLIPATPENFRVLESLRLGFEGLTEQLNKFLAPDNIMKAIAAIGSKQLPQPKLFEKA